MWDIIRQAANDIADMNNVEFMDETWNRLKQLEQDLKTWMAEAEGDIQKGIWEAMPEAQRNMLKASVNGTSFARYDPESRDYSSELAQYDYITFDFSALDTNQIICHITLRGRYLLKVNGEL